MTRESGIHGEDSWSLALLTSHLIYAAGNHEIDFAPEIDETHPFKLTCTVTLTYKPQGAYLHFGTQSDANTHTILVAGARAEEREQRGDSVCDCQVHSPWYNSNNYHYMEVDLVLAGHVHAYERSERFSNIKYNITNGFCTPVKDLTAPMYITIGDGGNIEGIAKQLH
ncbi:Purple acid phosphatase 6 [Raphanus sativus]|nr:Purple acid phosphatase 6 [Raphanus sativus]